MKKILHIISSPRGEASYSIKLGRSIVEKLIATYPGSTVKETVLANQRFPHLEEEQMISIRIPEDARTPEHQAALKLSDSIIEDLLEADILVIGAPMYNLAIHSTLKAWIDHIVRAGVTFKYENGGPKGLVLNKKVYVAIATGGVYSTDPQKAFDFVTPYLESVLSMIGLTDITMVRAEGTAIPGLQETAVEKAMTELVPS